MAEQHYCSDECRRKQKPCDLCIAQWQKQERRDNKPTLTHNPFAKLLEKRHG